MVLRPEMAMRQLVINNNNNIVSHSYRQWNRCHLYVFIYKFFISLRWIVHISWMNPKLFILLLFSETKIKFVVSNARRVCVHSRINKMRNFVFVEIVGINRSRLPLVHVAIRTSCTHTRTYYYCFNVSGRCFVVVTLPSIDEKWNVLGFSSEHCYLFESTSKMR